MLRVHHLNMHHYLPILPAFTNAYMHTSPHFRHYIVIIAAAMSKDVLLQWSGLVESKIRLLVGKLEANSSIKLAHVNPKSYSMEQKDVCVQHTLYSTHCTAHSVQHTLYSTQCTAHTAWYTLYSTHTVKQLCVQLFTLFFVLFLGKHL